MANNLWEKIVYTNKWINNLFKKNYKSNDMLI